MGALAPIAQWIPEDDLLLKNAVEAGASLESLAKGAIQFSRRFTIRELQERWHSLLYDPIISSEASARMIELERVVSNLSSKSNKADISKENKCGHGKRKADSVRRCYYALRKRICSDPLDHGDLGFLVPQSDNCFVTGAAASGPSNMLGDPLTNNFRLEDASFVVDDVFPQVLGNCVPPCSVSQFPIRQENTLEVPIEQNAIHEEVPDMLGNNMSMGGHCTRVGQVGTSKELPGQNAFEANGFVSKTMCNGNGVLCSDSGGNKIFSSHISGCENAFHQLQYSSAVSSMPDWRDMPSDVCMRGDSVQAGDPFGILDSGVVANGEPKFDGICPSVELNNVASDDLKIAAGCPEGFYDELTDTLFDFSNEEELLIDEKDGLACTYFDGLSSILLNSPEEDNESEMPDMIDTKESIGSGAYDDAGGTCAEDNNYTDSGGDFNSQITSEAQFPVSVATVDPQFPELQNGVVFCTLNTEDPDIPCNDDILFPSKSRSTASHKRAQNDASNSALPGKENTAGQLSDKVIGASRKEAKRFGESHPTSQTQVSDTSFNHTVKFEMARGESHNERMNSNIGYGGPCQNSVMVKKESSEVSLVRQVSCGITEKGSLVSEFGHLKNGINVDHQEVQTPSAMRVGGTDPMATEPVGEPLLSESDEPFSESDTDIPYFSDIESMILDMDLGPDDQDFFSASEVAKYQHEDAKRAIMRLEQNAHSYMQRAMASHGAFAILYGRHSKHYIKKPEVLLGRATDDIIVDIDLGREGRANKISRRQATIKMDKDGTFNLKNLGKCPIYINSKEIFPGQCLSLHSNCLIEIRGMPFIFEMNQTRVKQYLDNAAGKL